MRVAFLIDSVDAGGTELNAVRTAERLHRSGFALSLYALRAGGPLRERFQRAGVPVVELPVSSLASPSAVRQVRHLASTLRRERIDVLHCHDRYSNVLGVLAARLAGVPAIASRRWWTFGRSSHAVANALAYRLAHTVLTNSTSVAALLEREGIERGRVVVIPNFVDDDDFAPPDAGARHELLQRVGAPSNAILVGIVANLRPVKDHATLVRAVARLAPRWPALHVVCAGDGETARSVRALSAELGVASRVHVLGHVPSAARLHRLFDVSVLTSLHEGFPNSVIEAMAAARPVVATRVGGVVDAVIDGETGLLVSPGSAEQLAAALERLMEEPRLRAQMGEAGRVRAQREFHAEAVLPRLVDVYTRMHRGESRVPNRGAGDFSSSLGRPAAVRPQQVMPE